MTSLLCTSSARLASISAASASRPRAPSLWLYTHRMADAAASRDTLVEIRFTQDLYAPFYGGWQFDIEDPNGVSLYFHSP
jgi:DICT domain-containing protein